MQCIPVRARQDVEYTGEGFTSGREGITGVKPRGATRSDQ
jgi:hypothetical protein